jgi:hypothetical protein
MYIYIYIYIYILFLRISGSTGKKSTLDDTEHLSIATNTRYENEILHSNLPRKYGSGPGVLFLCEYTFRL